MKNWKMFAAISAAFVPVAYLFRQFNTTLFEYTMQVFCFALCILIFTVSFVMRRYRIDAYIKVLGAGMAAVAIMYFARISAYFLSVDPVSLHSLVLHIRLFISLLYGAVFLVSTCFFNKDYSYMKTLRYFLLAGVLLMVLARVRPIPSALLPAGSVLPRIIAAAAAAAAYAANMGCLWRKKDLIKKEVFSNTAVAMSMLMASAIMIFLADEGSLLHHGGLYLSVLALVALDIEMVAEGIRDPYNYVFWELNDQKSRDALTGLYNRTYYNEKLNEFIKAAEKDGSPFFLLIFDIDNFKSINDRYGHLVGDDVLKQVSGIIIEESGKSGVAARFGGDEFALLLRGMDESMARKISLRIKQRIADMRFDKDGARITISGGLGEYTGQPAQELIRAVDRMLYMSKEKGKNYICAVSENDGNEYI